MAVTPASFKAFFPEFASADDARVQTFLDMSGNLVNSDVWGTLHDYGILYLSAHLLYLANASAVGDGGTSGLISNKQVGDVSVSFLHSMPNSSKSTYFDAFYNTTKYGQQYYNLCRLVGITIVAVV